VEQGQVKGTEGDGGHSVMYSVVTASERGKIIIMLTNHCKSRTL